MTRSLKIPVSFFVGSYMVQRPGADPIKIAALNLTLRLNLAHQIGPFLASLMGPYSSVKSNSKQEFL